MGAVKHLPTLDALTILQTILQEVTAIIIKAETLIMQQNHLMNLIVPTPQAKIIDSTKTQQEIRAPPNMDIREDLSRHIEENESIKKHLREFKVYLKAYLKVYLKAYLKVYLKVYL